MKVSNLSIWRNNIKVLSMRIFSVRYGFATNSSSSHSIVFFSGNIPADEQVELHEFGWENFVCSSPDSKRIYFDLQLGRARDWVNSGTAHIDHQSCWDFPKDYYNESEIDKEFEEDLKAFLLQDRIGILGGNDNSDEHPLLSATKKFELPLFSGGSGVVRKDPQGFWTLFNRESGFKIRFLLPRVQYGVLNQPEIPVHSFYPELVDIKITNKCNKGCNFCYQNSVPEGKHAKFSDVVRLADILSRWKVFEVAIGGGEPTLHPRFEDIIKYFRSKGIIPNVSTRNLDIKDKDITNCGGVAFSVESPFDVKEVLRITRITRFMPYISFHVIEGIPSPEDFEEILLSAAEHWRPVVVLGYKPVGRGKNFHEMVYLDSYKWLDIYKKLPKKPTISIDTFLAKRDKKLLDQEFVPELFYETEEGMFSMYVDLVENKMGLSSFGKMQSFKFLTPKRLLDVFHSNFSFGVEEPRKRFFRFEL